MNSITNIPLSLSKKTLNSVSSIISHSCYDSLKSINKISIPKNSIITNCNYSSLSNSYLTNTQPLSKVQLQFYSTNNDSCNIQNACSTGIADSDKKKSEKTSTFNNSETPFDIRHEGALTPLEKLLKSKLENAFEPTAIIKVKDISDGCGSLYMVDVTSTKFDNLMMVKQHRIVMDVLEDELKTWHGIHIVTHPVHKRKRRRNNKKK